MDGLLIVIVVDDTGSARKISVWLQSDNTNSGELGDFKVTEIEQVLELEMVKLGAEVIPTTAVCKCPPQGSANWMLNISVPATALTLLKGVGFQVDGVEVAVM